MRAFAIVFVMMTASSAPAAIHPAVHAVLGGVLVLLGPACDQPPTRDCLSAEIARRTVRLRFERARCSGVLVGPRVVRTAAHCFTRGGRPLAVTTADGVTRRLDFQTWSKDTDPTNASAEYFDQAEIHAPADLARVDPLPIVPLGPGAVDRVVIAAGFAGGRPPLVMHAARVAARWARMNGLGALNIYLLAADDGWTVKPGQSGGPVFTAKACQLRLVGTINAFDDEFSYVQGWMPFRHFGANRRYSVGRRSAPTLAAGGVARAGSRAAAGGATETRE